MFQRLHPLNHNTRLILTKFLKSFQLKTVSSMLMYRYYFFTCCSLKQSEWFHCLFFNISSHDTKVIVSSLVQDFSVLSNYLQQFPCEKFLEAATDFHFLLYIAMMDVLPLFDSLGPLLTAIKERNSELANKWAEEEQWLTVKQLLVAQGKILEVPRTVMKICWCNNCNDLLFILSGGSPPPSRHSSSSDVAMEASSSTWTCKHCTFINTQDKSTCEICALPQN